MQQQKKNRINLLQQTLKREDLCLFILNGNVKTRQYLRHSKYKKKNSTIVKKINDFINKHNYFRKKKEEKKH